MQNPDWIELFQLIPESQHNTLVLTTLSGMDLSIETVLRMEMSYLVFRGRVCGQTDDGRVFFLPYRQIDFLQINRTVKEAEIRELFSDRPADAPASLGFRTITAPSSGNFPAEAPAPGSSSQAIPLSPATPAAPAAVTGRGSVPPPPAGRAAAPAPSLVGRLSNVPAAALHPQGAPPRQGNVPAAALVPPPNGGSGSIPPPPRNSILERLRAQRNAILPPRPPAR